MADKENDLIKVAGILTKRKDARVILDCANELTKDLHLSTDRDFAKDYFCIGWQACSAQKEAELKQKDEQLIKRIESLERSLNIVSKPRKTGKNGW